MHCRFEVKIHENSKGLGLTLKCLDEKLRKYLERKKANAPTRADNSINYCLRNGLFVNLSQIERKSIDMVVVGEMPTFHRSIEAIAKIYDGPIEIYIP